MRGLVKAGVVLLPFVALFLLLRACQGGEAERWRERIAEHDPGAVVAHDGDGLIVIAPNVITGQVAGLLVTSFRDQLIENYSDLLGRGSDERMVIVLFSSLERLQEAFGSRQSSPRGRTAQPEGWTDPSTGAVFLPPGSDPSTLHHETVHLLMAQARGPTVRHSPWLKEGLAQLFESYAPPDPPRIERNYAALLHSLIAPRGLDVDRLLAIDDYEEFVTREVQRNYAEALVLTAFLFERRPREALAHYIAIERESSLPGARREAFRGLFRADESVFQEDLRTYLASLASR